jgi:DnaA family protein
MTMGVPRQQMLLDLKPEQAPTLDNFVVGANGELLQRLRDLCDSHSFEALYVWGAPGGGKSHLLAATADAARQGDRSLC